MKSLLELDADGVAKLREQRAIATAKGITLARFLEERGLGENEAQYYGVLKKFNLNRAVTQPGFRASLKKETNGNSNGKHFVEFAPVNSEKIEVEFPSGLVLKMKLVDVQKLARA